MKAGGFWIVVSLGVLVGCTTDRMGRDVDPANPDACDPACSAGATCCEEGAGHACANLFDNPRHCGACGNSCGTGGTCLGGTCTGGTDGSTPTPGPDGAVGNDCFPTCSSSQRCCGTTCVNRSVARGVAEGRTDSSFLNCNGCGVACDAERASACGSPVGGGPPQCLCGSFSQCAVGQLCIQSGASFQCSNLDNDPANCGEVGRACQPGETCTGGECGCGGGPACSDGSACCSGACVPTGNDPLNCGGCGTVCGANAPDCMGGVCTCGGGPACASGDILSLGESCCAGACVGNSDASCACEACDPDAGQICSVGIDLISGAPTGDVCCSFAFGIDCGLDLGF